MKRTIATLISLFFILTASCTLSAEENGANKNVAKTDSAIFAAGCFWCIEKPFDEIDGVLRTTVGYTSGHHPNPNYKNVSAGTTGHTEGIKVDFDPSKVSYETLVDVLWKNIDPLVKDRQFCDVGSQYRAGIYFNSQKQKEVALKSKEALEKSKRFATPILTEIVASSEFFPAEDYHQDYYQKNPIRYKLYRKGCGRDKRLQELWGTK